MRKLNKRILLSGAAAVILALTYIPQKTYAYLIAHDSQKNAVTFGSVSAVLTEPNWPGNTSDKVKNIVSNQEIAKDPIVTNTGENDIVTFLVVTVPTAQVTLVSDTGLETAKDWREFVVYKQSSDSVQSHENNFDTSWIRLESKEDQILTDGSRTYVFGYSAVVSPGDSTEPLFDKIQLLNFRRNEISAAVVNDIKIKALAIQGSDIISSAGIDLTDGALDDDALSEIYDIYINTDH